MSDSKQLPIYDLDKHDDDAKSSLMGHRAQDSVNVTSVVEPPKKLWPGYIIMLWIALSSSVIMQNAYLLRTLEFTYPIWLTTFHLVYATIGTRLMLRFTHLLDGLKDVQMSWDRWFKNIVPIGALFSASLIFSNLAYLTLSVSFIQMLKAFTSVAVLGLSVFMGLEKMVPQKFVIVICISAGVALASYGEIFFDATGFVYQALGIAFEAARLVTIQKLLTGLKMSPLVSLYYFAPVCAGLNLLLIPFFEGAAPFNEVLDKIGAPLLIVNASTALALNVAVVFLIGSASSLVLTLSGVIKDILLVVGSIIFLGSTITFTQMVGYSIALAGLVAFKQDAATIDRIFAKIKATAGLR